MIEVKQIKNFEKLRPILEIFCQENQLTKEKTIERIQAFEKQFDNADFQFFLATVNGKSKGFLSCEIAGDIIRTYVLFVPKSENYDDFAFEIIQQVSKLLVELQRKYFQVFFVNSLQLEQKLSDNGFSVYHRVRMTYDLMQDKKTELHLDPAYQLENFVLEKLDDELQVIVNANKNTLDGEIFQQFSTLEVLKDFFHRCDIAGKTLREDSPVIIHNSKIVGVNIVTNFTETTSYIWIIALLAEHRGKGLGKYLMLKAHENCKNTGVEQMVLDVTLDNNAAYNLYKHLGYKETARYLTAVKKYRN
jgi:ribosomal protein S18 acetylase RimI-like enzyme